jgi:hypothetical protein
MRCDVCGAPAVIREGACVFCRTPIKDSHAPVELLTYLESRLPAVRSKRFGLIRRGHVRDLRLEIEGEEFRARVVKGALVLKPDLPPAQWVERLLVALSRTAARDPALRATLTRAGWALR